jgi:hypothetical protein
MGTTTFDETQLGCGMPAPDGSVTCMGSGMSMPMQGWDLDMWNITLNPDPYVTANTVVTNTTGMTQDFVLEVILPISHTVGPPVRMRGSIVGGVTDSGSGSATVGFVVGNALYSAMIDNTIVRTLNDALPVTATGAFNSASIGPDRFGFPTLEVLTNTTATTNIAIRLRFSLTAGDSASFTSVFSIIPEPSTAMLLGFGLLGLLAAGRRRRA